MGGAEVLHYAARGPADVRRQITGYVVESPWIALHPATQPSRALVLAGRLAARVMPRMQMVQKVEPKWVSRDEEVCKAYIADELCHDTGTLEGLAGMLNRAAELDRGEIQLKDGEGECRIWLAHGNLDHVTSFDASQRFMQKLEVRDKEFKVYDGWYHKCKFRYLLLNRSLILSSLIISQYMLSLEKTKQFLQMTWRTGFLQELM